MMHGSAHAAPSPASLAFSGRLWLQRLRAVAGKLRLHHTPSAAGSTARGATFGRRFCKRAAAGRPGRPRRHSTGKRGKITCLQRSDFETAAAIAGSSGAVPDCLALWLAAPDDSADDGRWLAQCFPARAWLAVGLHCGADDAQRLADLLALARASGLPAVAAGVKSCQEPRRSGPPRNPARKLPRLEPGQVRAPGRHTKPLTRRNDGYAAARLRARHFRAYRHADPALFTARIPRFSNQRITATNKACILGDLAHALGPCHASECLGDTCCIIRRLLEPSVEVRCHLFGCAQIFSDIVGRRACLGGLACGTGHGVLLLETPGQLDGQLDVLRLA
jgi:hypothetical protein